jgi:DNA-binding MarR family transcriptional regulator
MKAGFADEGYPETPGGRSIRRKNGSQQLKVQKVAKRAPALPIGAVFRMPTFLIRRAHQIATSVFTQACQELNLTPSQYAVLFALRHSGECSQNELGRAVALDRCTTSLVVRTLFERDLVRKSDDASDQRKIVLRLTDAGRLLLVRAERLSAKASREMLAVMGGNQAQALVNLLEKFTLAHAGR